MSVFNVAASMGSLNVTTALLLSSTSVAPSSGLLTRIVSAAAEASCSRPPSLDAKPSSVAEELLSNVQAAVRETRASVSSVVVESFNRSFCLRGRAQALGKDGSSLSQAEYVACHERQLCFEGCNKRAAKAWLRSLRQNVCKQPKHGLRT